jgi:hypothetical protein
MCSRYPLGLGEIICLILRFLMMAAVTPGLSPILFTYREFVIWTGAKRFGLR